MADDTGPNLRERNAVLCAEHPCEISLEKLASPAFSQSLKADLRLIHCCLVLTRRAETSSR